MNKKDWIYVGAAVVLSSAAIYVLYRVANKPKDKSNPLIGGGNETKNDSIKSILFIGDSNTEANFSYADQLRKMFPNINIKKIAKAGKQTAWMREELEKELKNNKYDVISILGGSNDIYATGTHKYATLNLDYIYDLAHKNGAKVVAISPPNKDYYTKKTPEKQAALYNLVNFIKDNPKKDYYIDFWTITRDKKFFSAGDGYLHAQAPAHKILANEFANKLNLK
jgi:hypothetical protein